MAVTAINYLIADLFVLPSKGNGVALVTDGLLALFTAFVLDLLSLTFRTSLFSLVWFGIIIGVSEYYFHIHLIKDDKVEPKFK